MEIMESESIFQRDNQWVSADDILQGLSEGKELDLKRCTISGELDINRLFSDKESFDPGVIKVKTDGSKRSVVLEKGITFKSCTFEDNVCFASPWESPDEVEVVFKRDVLFNSSVFCGQSRFSRASFEGLGSFDGCTFQRITTFRDTSFCERAMFRTVLFNGYGLFNGSVFSGQVHFSNSCFGKGGNFTNVRFNGQTDFSGVFSKSKSVPVYESVIFGRQRYGEDVTFWRFIKQSCQDAGLYRQAGEAFYSEMCAHFWRQFYGPNFGELSAGGKCMRYIKGIRLLPELIFGRLLFGYGERPIRVLLASVLIIVACAIFYWSPYAELSGRAQEVVPDLSLLDGLYFSTTTFTTLGFGDIFPDPGNPLTRFVAMCEAVSGASLMALFVVCLSKRFSRG